VKEGSKARKEEEAKEHGQHQISIQLLERNKHRVGQWQSKMFRIGQPRGKRNVMGFPPPTAVFYS
jgi:hypothetical protein